MDAFVDNYRHFVESKVPRGVKLLGWFSLGAVQIYMLRSWAASGARKEVTKIRAKQLEIGTPAKK